MGLGKNLCLTISKIEWGKTCSRHRMKVTLPNHSYVKWSLVCLNCARHIKPKENGVEPSYPINLR